MKRMSLKLFLSMIIFAVHFSIVDQSEAQVYESTYAVANSPMPMQPVPWSYNSRARTANVQMTYAAFYAPQVPTAYGPVSAYYVPTVPVAQQFYVPVVPRHKHFHKHLHKHKRHRVSTVGVAVVPAAVIHPVYWMPY
jgi:hypothetical protein